MNTHYKTWTYYVKELYDGTGDAGADTVCCALCGKRIETITANFSRSDGEPLCTGCTSADATEE